MLILYEEKMKEGRLCLQAEPRVVRQNAVTALIDGGAGLGHPAAVMAMHLAVEKAKASGIGAVSVTNSFHFGAAGYYARMAAEQGLVGLVASNAPTVAVMPTRASTRVFGTNPIAFAAPARRHPPYLLDMATSTVAAAKVRVYHFAGKPLPDGWVLDEKGDSLHDAGVALEYIFRRDEGGLSPIGGTAAMASHKGYGLGMMAQILGSTLAGGSFPALARARGVKSGPFNLGHFFLALDPKVFRSDGGFESDLDEMIDFLHDTPAIDPAQPVLVAGDPEFATRQHRLKEGVPIPVELANSIRAICLRCGAPYLLDLEADEEVSCEVKAARTD